MKLLIIKPSSLGDIIHALRVVQSIKEQASEPVHVTWVVRDSFRLFVDSCHTVDQSLIFYRGQGLQAYFKLLKQIRADRFDYVLDMQGLARSAGMTLAAKSPHKWGRSDAREGARFAYNKRVPLPQMQPGTPPHAIDILLQFLPPLNLEPTLQGKLTFESEPADTLLAPLVGKLYFLVAPHSRVESKEWHRYPELIQKLAQLYPDHGFVFNSHKAVDFPQCEGLLNVVNTCGQTSLKQMIALIAGAQAVLTVDTAPLHLAAAMGKPVFSIFGPTDPRRYGAYPDNGLHKTLWVQDKPLQDLTVEEALTASKRWIESLVE